MSIDIACPNCGRLIFAPDHLAGKDLLCPGCGKPVQVVGSNEMSSPAEEPVSVACPTCDASIRLVPKLLGRRVACNTCRTVLQVSLTLQKIDEPRPVSAKRTSHDAAQDTDRQYSTQHDKRSHRYDDTELKVPKTADESLPACRFPLDPQGVYPRTQAEREPARAISEYENDSSSGDFVFGFPEDAFPANSSPSAPQKVSTRTRARQESDLAFPEHEEDHSPPSDDLEIDLPETAIAVPESAEDAAPSGPAPLTPQEASVASRDREISAALRHIQAGGHVPKVHERVPVNSINASRVLSPSDRTAPWFWPLITAMAATCLMLAMLYVILYVL